MGLDCCTAVLLYSIVLCTVRRHLFGTTDAPSHAGVAAPTVARDTNDG